MRQHDRVGSAQARQGFSKQATREHVAETKWFGCVDQNNVQISSRSAMLKSIVEKDCLDVRFSREKCRSAGDAIRIRYERNG